MGSVASIRLILERSGLKQRWPRDLYLGMGKAYHCACYQRLV